MYPLDSIQLADILPGDKEDTFLHLVDQFETKNRRTHHLTGKMMGRRVKEPIEVEYHK